jgi:hypothetical protein
MQQRRALFEMLEPVALTNCQLEKFGEAHDGGYLMCGRTCLTEFRSDTRTGSPAIGWIDGVRLDPQDPR